MFKRITALPDEVQKLEERVRDLEMELAKRTTIPERPEYWEPFSPIRRHLLTDVVELLLEELGTTLHYERPTDGKIKLIKREPIKRTPKAKG